ncbi:CDP-glycerol glycerophosphotransferase family protein [Aeromonas veronii]|uniref:CDP-glycerol glycerophosphotransferase family protein n=1 Tax=Aeromonas veronii TaxID=654 RepID=UPI0030051A55
MLALLRKILPIQVKNAIRPVKNKFIDPLLKMFLFQWMQRKHNSLIKSKKGKERLRVVFLVIHRSVWKIDSVFQGMLNDPLFEPIILVCPYTHYGDAQMWDDLNETYEYFNNKGYKTVSSYDQETGTWLDLTELEPDIVFFTNPHDLTRKEYYQHAFSNYLSCYVPYHHEVGSYGGNVSQYNGFFHNSMWKIFASHQASFELFKKKSACKARNVIVTGYPAMEELYLKIKNKHYKDVWGKCSSKLRVIWAPHHTIDSPELPYSNFLKYAELMKELVETYENNIVWAFKPHPILKAKLYQHKDWGVEKTNDYYAFWKNDKRTQLEEGEYTDLFCSSDALIHDSGSFLAEYLYTQKPVMYLISEHNSSDFYSDFGVKALDATKHGFCADDIKAFIESLIKKQEVISDAYHDFYSKELNFYFEKTMPSECIINEIKGLLG